MAIGPDKTVIASRARSYARDVHEPKRPTSAPPLWIRTALATGLSAALVAFPYRHKPFDAAMAFLAGGAWALVALSIRPSPAVEGEVRSPLALWSIVVLVGGAAAGGTLAPAWRAPLEGFVAQQPGQSAWLIVRVLLLGGLVLGAPSTESAKVEEARGRPRASWLILTAAVSVSATFLANVLILPWLLGTAVCLGRFPPRWPFALASLERRPRAAMAVVAVLALGSVAATAGSVRRAPNLHGASPVTTKDPALATAEWRALGNPWEARYAANAWARSERPKFGRGHLALALAMLDPALVEREHDQERARAVAILHSIADQSDDQGVRSAAQAELDALARSASGAQ